MEEPKSIDALVAKRQLHEAEIKQLGERIRASARNAAVVFVDLSDSTSMKEGTDPDVWLGSVFAFIRSVERRAHEYGGTVVKRIGDEVLVTFGTASASEDFIEALFTDGDLLKYRFKVAADFGEVFFFKFEEHLEPDPYGGVVDRCARIAKLATSGNVLCSAPYEAQVRPRDSYVQAGTFKLAGISPPEPVFVRRGRDVGDQAAYLRPLLDALNAKEMQRPHYQFVSRWFSPSDFKVSKESWGHPFLIRELLNVPHLPLSLAQFADKVRSVEYDDQRLDNIGYLVEWEGVYTSSEPIGGDFLCVFVRGPKPAEADVVLRLPLFMTDVVRKLKKDTTVRFRGIIVKVDRYVTTLDFVDLALPEGSGE